MNWVGGARKRVHLQNERRSQNQYFERKEWERKMNIDTQSSHSKTYGGWPLMSQDIQAAIGCLPGSSNSQSLGASNRSGRESHDRNFHRVPRMNLLPSQFFCGVAPSDKRNTSSGQRIKSPATCTTEQYLPFFDEPRRFQISRSERSLVSDTIWCNDALQKSDAYSQSRQEDVQFSRCTEKACVLEERLESICRSPSSSSQEDEVTANRSISDLPSSSAIDVDGLFNSLSPVDTMQGVYEEKEKNLQSYCGQQIPSAADQAFHSHGREHPTSERTPESCSTNDKGDHGQQCNALVFAVLDNPSLETKEKPFKKLLREDLKKISSMKRPASYPTKSNISLNQPSVKRYCAAKDVINQKNLHMATNDGYLKASSRNVSDASCQTENIFQCFDAATQTEFDNETIVSADPLIVDYESSYNDDVIYSSRFPAEAYLSAAVISGVNHGRKNGGNAFGEAPATMMLRRSLSCPSLNRTQYLNEP